ncbi:hypothetical protein BSF41_17550 [Flavobacterium sp. ACN2]|jgi:hypothetical protein|uniref:hypothetical protein n=1 Tax=Flavobacterium sp. ACN2 TaxID=1975676 RepID=UPI000BB3B57A|nr:hypothetical protein [Flavobacterium sp. ACN2]PBI90084.1 hypothetical protein BSF41_17550 [Flavobacterium sp. ACN2]
MKIVIIKNKLFFILTILSILLSCKNEIKKNIANKKGDNSTIYFNGRDTIRLFEKKQKEREVKLIISNASYTLFLSKLAMCEDNLTIGKVKKTNRDQTKFSFEFEVLCRDFFEDYVFDFDSKTKKYYLETVVQKINKDEKIILSTQTENDTVFLIRTFTINKTLKEMDKTKIDDALLSTFKLKEKYLLRKDSKSINEFMQ